MGHFGADVYPYVLYDLNGNDNLAAYLSSLGYATCAAHPPTPRTGGATGCTPSWARRLPRT